MVEGDSGGQVQGVYVTRQEESQGSCGEGRDDGGRQEVRMEPASKLLAAPQAAARRCPHRVSKPSDAGPCLGHQWEDSADTQPASDVGQSTAHSEVL